MPYKKKSDRLKYYQEHKEKLKEYNKKYKREYKKEILKNHKDYNREHREEINEYAKKYRQENKCKVQKYRDEHSEQYKLYDKRSQAKRKRILGFELLFNNPFPDSIPVEYHHISDSFVVAIPKSLHKNHYGKNHREKLKPFVESIYDITYIIVEHSYVESKSPQNMRMT